MPLKAVNRMLLGIFFVLLGIFCTLFSVSFSGFELLELVALFSPLLGLGLVLFGFFQGLIFILADIFLDICRFLF